MSEAVYEQLRDQILSGQLKPGEPLPGERKLSEILAANRGGVREALKRLVQAGLVETQHGGSTRVLDYRRSGTLDLVAQALVGKDGQLDLSVGRSLLEFRCVVLAEVARLAAERASPESLYLARQKLDLARLARGDVRRVRELTLEIWEILADAAQNIAFALALNTLRAAYQQVDLAVGALPFGEHELVDLETILTAVEKRDGESAQRHARARFETFEQKIRTQLEAPRASSPAAP